MQRYRVNYVLLIGLIVGLFVAAGSIYGVWVWQMTGNANQILDRANEAEAEGDYKEAVLLLNNYLGFRPKDDDVRVRQAMLYVDLAEKSLEEDEIRTFIQSKQAISNALFKFPGEVELRSRFVELLSAPNVMGAFAKEMLEHVKVLLASKPNDSELLLKQARCLNILKQPAEAAEVLYKMVGYDAATDQFVDAQAITPNELDAYRMLSRTLLQLERKELAIRVEERMVENNPDSAEAYLERGQFYTAINEGEGSPNDYGKQAEADLNKAYELEPGKPEVLLAKAAEAQKNGDFEATREFLEKGLESDTDMAVFYTALSRLEREKGDYKSALEQLDRGMEKVDDRQKRILLVDRIDVLIDSKNLTGAEETIKELEEEMQMKLPQVEFQEARIMASRNQWLKASRVLEEVRPKLSGDKRLQTQLDLLLGLAYQKVGYPEKALEVFAQLARENPGNDRIRQQTEALRVSLGGGSNVDKDDTNNFSARLAAELEKPEEEQDWKAFNAYLNDWVEKNNRSEVQAQLLKSQVFVSRKKYAEARDELRKAYAMAKDDLNVQRAVVRLVAVDPDGGPEDALKLLDRTVDRFGDQWQLRLDRADMIVSMNNETLVEDLLAVPEGTEDWERSHQVELWKGVASRLNRLGKQEESEEAWKKVAELSPNDLPTLMQVFQLALARNDDEAMQEAQKKVLDLVGSKSDANWAFTEAARKFVQYRREPGSEKLYNEILKLVDTALEDRPEWSAPYILRAELATLERNYLKALEDYKKGFDRGRGNARAISQYVRLLVAQGSFQEAANLLEPFDPSVNVILVGQLYPTILLRTGEFRDAAEAADRLAEAGKERGQVQLWYGNFMQGLVGIAAAPEDLREECQQKATEALAKAVELNGDNPAPWLAYFNNLLTSGKPAEAAEVLRKAQLTLEEDQQQLLLARCYENMGRWFDAENIYRNTYSQNPESEQVARQLASFYLSKRYPLPDGQTKAVKLINDILRQSAEETDSVSRQDSTWARRTAARMLAASGDYQNLLKAEKVLASNSVNGTLSVEDKLEMARLLAGRPEPVSRTKAVKLLEEVQSQQQLSPDLDLTLGQLYFALGNWPKCREHMLRLITRYPDSFAVRNAYIRMLLNRGGDTDLKIAERQLPSLVKIAPRSPATLELASMVYNKSGQESKARQALQRMLPSDLSELDATGLRVVARVAMLLTELGDLENAERLLQTLMRRPEASLGDQLQFIRFVGIHRDANRAFQMLEEAAEDDNLLAILETATAIVREKRDELGDQFDDTIVSWLDRAEREDPGSVNVALARAGVLDIQSKYEEAAKIYRDILDNGDLVARRKAAVLNNLAYLLALGAAEEQAAGEAVGLMRQAVDILGPIPDILDTRATIWLGRGEYQAAVDDMELAVTESPTASKYFHKAQAHMGLGQKGEALAAWEKAERLGLDRDSVGWLEQEEYDKLASQIEKVRKQGNNL